MTTSTTDYWRTRAETYGPGWCEHYWDSWQAPHRLAIADLIASFEPDSVLEVGCHCGPNLRLLRARLPLSVSLAGIEVNDEAINFGRERFAYDRLVRLMYGALPGAMIGIPDGWYSVAFSCYSLTYLSASDAMSTLARMLRVAHQAVVIAEPISDDPAAREHGHDYADWISAMLPKARQRTVAIPRADNLDRALLVEYA